MQWVFPIISSINSSLAFNKFFDIFNNYLNFYSKPKRISRLVSLVNLTLLQIYLFINSLLVINDNKYIVQGRVLELPLLVNSQDFIIYFCRYIKKLYFYFPKNLMAVQLVALIYLTINKRFFILTNILNKYGGCSLVVECGPVAPEMGVRFPPSAFLEMEVKLK